MVVQVVENEQLIAISLKSDYLKLLPVAPKEFQYDIANSNFCESWTKTGKLAKTDCGKYRIALRNYQ